MGSPGPSESPSHWMMFQTTWTSSRQESEYSRSWVSSKDCVPLNDREEAQGRGAAKCTNTERQIFTACFSYIAGLQYRRSC